MLYSQKFDEFQATLAKSNEVYTVFKQEMEKVYYFTPSHILNAYGCILNLVCCKTMDITITNSVEFVFLYSSLNGNPCHVSRTIFFTSILFIIIMLIMSLIYLDDQEDEETGEGVKCVENTL